MAARKDAPLREIETDLLVALRRNPQYLTPHQMDALKSSMQRDGFLAPVLVRPLDDERFEIVSGNHRVMAAREIGLPTVPCLVAALSDDQAKRAAVNLNTVHGDPPVELLAPFLAEMDDDLLATIHIDETLLPDLLEFDATLADSLTAMTAPDAFDHASPSSSLAKCSCPTCGRVHFRLEEKKKIGRGELLELLELMTEAEGDELVVAKATVRERLGGVQLDPAE